MTLMGWFVFGVVALILVVIIAALAASQGMYFTEVPEGTTVSISAGESMQKIFPNVAGHRLSNDDDLDGRRWLVTGASKDEVVDSLFKDCLPTTRRLQRFLWTRFGVRFISIFWPQVHVQEIDIRSRRQLLDDSEVKADATLRDRIKKSEKSTVVTSLLFVVPRPTFIEGVELPGDNAKINILALVVYQQVVPVIPVYYLKGDFFTPLDSAVEAAIVDFCARHRVAVFKADSDDGKMGEFAHDTYDPPLDDRGENKKYNKTRSEYVAMYEPAPLTYAHWLKLDKGRNSPLNARLLQLNVSNTYVEALRARNRASELVSFIEKAFPSGTVPSQLEGKVPATGIVPRFGFGLASFRLVGFEAHGSTADLAKAILAKQTKFHEGQGKRADAEADRDAFRTRAQGEAARFSDLVDALIKNGVDPNMAAKVVETQLRTENIRNSPHLTTYVEGGASAQVAIPTGQQPK